MINWKQMPEGATYWDSVCERFCNLNGFWHTDGTYVHQVSLDLGTDKYIARPVAAEAKVYTQAMCDAGEIPQVGTRFICGKELSTDSRTAEFKLKEVIVIGLCELSLGHTVITFSHKSLGVGCGIFFSSWVLPVDTRTDKEKEIDDICILIQKQRTLAIKQLLPSEILSIAYDKWVGKQHE